jgi:hypothetical protein
MSFFVVASGILIVDANDVVGIAVDGSFTRPNQVGSRARGRDPAPGRLPSRHQ